MLYRFYCFMLLKPNAFTALFPATCFTSYPTCFKHPVSISAE